MKSTGKVREKYGKSTEKVRDFKNGGDEIYPDMSLLQFQGRTSMRSTDIRTFYSLVVALVQTQNVSSTPQVVEIEYGMVRWV